LRITDSQAVRLRQTSLEISGAGLDLEVTGGIFTGSGKFVASTGSLKLTAHSPIVIGSGGLEASQGISLLATTPEGASTILIDGPLTSTSGPITLSAYNDITLNANLTATAIQRSSQIGSIQEASNVAVSETAPVVITSAPVDQVTQTVATSLATATTVATAPATASTPTVEKPEPSATTTSSAVPVTTGTGSGSSLLLANLSQTIGGGDGQFGSAPASSSSTNNTAASSANAEKPAATAEKTAQAETKPETKQEAKAEAKKEEKKEEKTAKDDKEESGEKKPATKVAQKKVAQCS
jgi:hypothetical protein